MIASCCAESSSTKQMLLFPVEPSYFGRIADSKYRTTVRPKFRRTLNEGDIFFCIFFHTELSNTKTKQETLGDHPKKKYSPSYLGGYAPTKRQEYTAPLAWRNTTNKYIHTSEQGKTAVTTDYFERLIIKLSFCRSSQSTKTCLSTRSNPPLVLFCFFFSSLSPPHVFPPMISAEVKAAVAAITARDKAVDSKR